jgi:hypothetical protein
MDGPLGALIYVVVKYAAYSLWCALGVRWLAPSGRSAFHSGLKFGFVRLLIGVVAGFAIFFIGGVAHLSAWNNGFLQYLVVYAPVRWFEWGIMELLVTRSGRNPVHVFILGANGGSRRWRLGGILVSHLADIPMVVMGTGFRDMLPIGRFLC